MTSESKILTVSYGTFSCTLEGFDDPFNTMKAIAEYFRDLAGEDRYFGAEPPTPDAAMLHRIAEREVQRMVEARVQNNGVFLRQQDDGTVAQPATPAVPRPALEPARPAALAEPMLAEPAPAAPQTAADLEKQRVSEKAQDGFAADAAEDDTLPMLQDVIPSGVAAKLARIRQSVNATPMTPVLTPETLAAFAVAPQAEVVVQTADIELTALETTPEPLADITVALAVDGDADPDAAALDDALSRLLSLPEDDADDMPQPDAASLALTEAKDDIDGWLADADGHDDQALPVGDDPEPAGGTDLTDIATGVDPTPAADEATPDMSPVAMEAVDLAADDDFGAAPDFHTGIADEVEPEPTVDAGALAATSGPTAPAALVLSEALLLTETAAEAEQPVSLDEAIDSLPEDLPQDRDDEVAAELTAGLAVDDDTSDAPVSGVAGKSRRASSRVLRMRRDEADTATSADKGTAAAKATTGEDAEMTRLLRQADDEMADADNRRRLDAIAHLKAAVAATEAERAVTGTAINPPGAKIEPYRDDLAQVVQPTEPEPEQPVRPRRQNVTVRTQEPRPGTIRPGMIGPAPLVLVSEQRIDRTPPTGQPMVAVRSGRLSGAIGSGATAPQPPRPEVARPEVAPPAATPVSATDHDDDEPDTDDNIFVDAAGFSSFAEQVGVRSMADMLEAAAAYATCIEQRDQFTRPQLMRRLIASAAGKPVSREDGLRSFGTLLRTGRIEKVSRGHYALADNSPYLAEARRIAQ